MKRYPRALCMLHAGHDAITISVASHGPNNNNTARSHAPPGGAVLLSNIVSTTIPVTLKAVIQLSCSARVSSLSTLLRYLRVVPLASSLCPASPVANR